jgi:hypothetical protein
MSWHAVDAVDDAVDATRRFLLPLAVVWYAGARTTGLLSTGNRRRRT